VKSAFEVCLRKLFEPKGEDTLTPVRNKIEVFEL